MNFYIKSLFVLFCFFFWGSFCYAYSSNTTTYWCDGGCGGEIVYQSCHSSQSSCCSSDDDEGEESTCEEGEMTTTCGAIIKTGVKAEPWQKCVGGSQAKGSWSYCGDSGDFSHGNKFYFVCSGDCLYNVSEVRYYDNPTYPKNPELTIDQSETYPETCSAEDLEKDNYSCIEPSESSSSVLLPLKIDWDEDLNWMSSTTSSVTQFVSDLSYIPVYEGKSIFGPQSYKIIFNVDSELVNGPTSTDQTEFSDYISKNFDEDTKEMGQGYFYKVLNVDSQPSYIEGGNYRSSEYNFRVDHNPCWFKSGQDYSLKIQTCCNKDGTDCNSGGTFDFTTALAPELKSPEDLDWSGEGYSAWNAWPQADSVDDFPLNNEDYNPFDWETQTPSSGLKLTPPVYLDWCDIDSGKTTERTTNSYSILPQVFETDSEGATEKLCILNKTTSQGCLNISKTVTDDFVSEYTDMNNYVFTKNSLLSWQVRGCPTIMAGICQSRPYSQEWYLETGEADLGPNTNIVPSNGAIIGLPVNVSWNNPYGYVSAKFELYKGSILVDEKDISGIGISYSDLDLKTTYSWRFKNCTDRYLQNCDDWSSFYSFTVTGESPELIHPQGEISPSLSFAWNPVEGANSYILKVQGGNIDKEIKLKQNILNWEYSEDLPLKTETDYQWMVKTCADIEGNKCGDYSNPLLFKIKIDSTSNLVPENTLLSLYESNNSNLEWDDIEGATVYELSFNYTKGAEEASSSCVNFTKTKIVDDNEYNFNPQCLGNYVWKVRGCFSDNCDEGTFSNWSDSNSFTIYQNINPNTGEMFSENNENVKSLVPCGRLLDDPNTSWNEREACSFPHLLIIVRNILDFVLWRFIPFALVMGLIYSAIIIFTAFGNPAVIAKTKTMWKYVGIGIAVIFLSWTAIDFLLSFMGYNVGLFGLLVK